MRLHFKDKIKIFCVTFKPYYTDLGSPPIFITVEPTRLCNLDRY